MVSGWMMTASMSSANTTANHVRLFCGQDCDGMVRKLEDVALADGDSKVSSLEIRETALEDDVIDSIVDLLSKGSVKTIHLEDCYCSAHLNESAVKLVEALGNCRDVRLSESTFLSKFFLETFLESATQLKNLRIRDHLLVDQVEALSRGLASNKILHTLDLSRSRIDDFSSLAEGLKGGCAKKLKLRSIGLRDGHLATLMAALESSTTLSTTTTTTTTTSTSTSMPTPTPNAAATALESLDLSFNRLRNLKCIGDFLKHRDCNLRELLIGYQNLWQPSNNGTNIDVSEIATALLHNRRLTTLKLTRNELGDADAILFAVGLAENPTLETLDLRENKIGDEGVLALAKAAQHSRGLQQLNLRGNPFGRRASLGLLEAASTNFRLAFVGDNGREHESTNNNSSNTNDGDDENAINLQIRYHTALNRGGRKLLVNDHEYGHEDESNIRPSPSVPLGLWPFVLEKQASRMDWEGGADSEKHSSSDKTGDVMRTDVLFYLLKESSATFFPCQTTGKDSKRTRGNSST